MSHLSNYQAKGSFLRRVRSILFLLPAWFAPHKSLRVLCHRLRGVKIGRGVEIGYFCIIGNVHPHMVHIEDGAVVTARSTILEHDNSYYYTGVGPVRLGEVHIGRRAFIGIGSLILPGVTVGAGSIVGAMSLVNRDVPEHCVVAGTPARVIRRLDVRSAA